MICEENVSPPSCAVTTSRRAAKALSTRPISASDRSTWPDEGAFSMIDGMNRFRLPSADRDRERSQGRLFQRDGRADGMPAAADCMWADFLQENQGDSYMISILASNIGSSDCVGRGHASGESAPRAGANRPRLAAHQLLQRARQR